jgi:hypothetical protein
LKKVRGTHHNRYRDPKRQNFGLRTFHCTFEYADAVPQAPTEHFPPLSTPAAAPIAENLPYRIIEIKDKKKGKCRKK